MSYLLQGVIPWNHCLVLVLGFFLQLMDRKVFVILFVLLVLQILMRKKNHQKQVREATAGGNRTPRNFSVV